MAGPAWIPCGGCEEFWCTIHGAHASQCPCPPIEDWEVDPYSDAPAGPLARSEGTRAPEDSRAPRRP